MHFNLIDRKQWSRETYFNHYWDQVRCTFSLTAHVDITLLQRELKRRSMKLYPALIHAVATIVNRHVEFRTCLDRDGKLGYWDQLIPAYTIFHKDDCTFSNLWTDYHKQFSMFYPCYMDDMKQFGHMKGFTVKKPEPANTFPISSIPWVSFTSFNLNVYGEGTYLLPIFTFGKYNQQADRLLLPLSVQLHHAVCDGYHAGVLFEELQERFKACEDWLPASSEQTT